MVNMPRHGLSVAAAALSVALLCSCAASRERATQTGPSASILAASTPTAGATVAAPVNEIRFVFNPPARLDEVTVQGPNGLMPMMVGAMGEARDYSIPVNGLEGGSYLVKWRASIGQVEHQGSFAFQVR